MKFHPVSTLRVGEAQLMKMHRTEFHVGNEFVMRLPSSSLEVNSSLCINR